MKSKTDRETLRVTKPPKYLCFELCSDDELPNDKGAAELMIDTLASFHNHQKLSCRGLHPLSGGTDRKSKLHKYFEKANGETVYSVDVGKRGSKKHGDRRLLYYISPSDTNVAKILTVFTKETH